MSFTAARESKDVRRSCQICHERKARFRYQGKVRADRGHVLCFACYRSQCNRRRAARLLEIHPTDPLPPPFGSRPLTAREVTHRREMLAHLSLLVGAR